MASEDFVTIGIEGDADPLVAEIQGALRKAFGGLEGDLTRVLSSAFRGGSQGARQFQRSFADMGEAATKSFSKVKENSASVDRAMEGLSNTLRQVRSAMGGELFGPAQNSAKRLIELSDRLTTSMGELRQAATRGDEAATSALRSAANAQNVILQTISREVLNQNKVRANAERVAEQSATKLAVQGSKERIVAAQQEGAQIIAATRSQGQARAAIIRGVFSQMRQGEKLFGTLFQGTAGVLGRGVTGISSVLSSVGAVFRRSNRQMTEGLEASMSKRSGILRSGLSRQETIVRESLTRQQRVVQRFNETTSRGITGIASGRSNVANALGIGGLVGGSFLAFSRIKDAIKGAQDFNQTMAVLQQQLGLTDKQMGAVRQTSIDLGNDLSLPGVSAKDAGDAINILTRQFGSLGTGAVTAAQKAAKGTLQLARASGASAAEAGAIIGAAVNVFGIAADQSVSIADKVTGALAKAAGVGFSDFKDAFVQGATVFENFVGPAESANDVLLDFNTTLAVLAKNGIVGEQAGAGLKQFFIAVTGKQSKKALALQKEIAQRAGETGTIFFNSAGKARTFTDSIDLLRKGLEGMTDQQRTTTLTALFGARAQTVASALVKGSAKDWDALRKSMQQQGLAAKVAAAQNQGLRGAMDALGSVFDTLVIQGFDKVDKPLGNFVVGIADLVNKIANAGGVFQVIRDGLKGIAAGLGALLAVKGAIEVIQLLGAALGAALTPIGLLVVGVAGAGAAISILSKRSEGFRKFVDNLKQRAIDLGKQGFDFLKEKAGQLADFVTGSALPALKRIADLAKVNIVAGFKVASHFISETVIPSLQRFVDFVQSDVIPTVRDKLGQAFDAAASGIAGFWHVVEPVLRPAIDGIDNLVDAIVELSKTDPGKALLSLGGIIAAAVGGFAVGGPAGAAIAGAGATVAAIFANGLQDNLGNALSGIGGSIARAFQNLLSKIDLGSLVGKAFEGTAIAQTIGRFLGRALSSPQLVAAVAGTAGFLAVLAGRFVLGFGQGILANVPALGRMLLEALSQALRFAGQAVLKADLNTVALGIAAAFAAPRILAVFRRFGTQAGTEVQQGLVSSFRSKAFGGIFGGGGSAGGFFTGLFGGGRGLDAALQREFGKAQLTTAAGVRKMNATLALVGRSVGRTDIGSGQSFGAAVRQQFDQLEKEIGPKGILGLRIRGGFSAALQSIKTVSLAPIRDFFKNMGVTATAAAKSIGKGAAIALAGAFAGFQTGKALVGQSGLEQLLGVGGLALSLGAANPLLGAAAGLAGAAGIAFGNMGKDASESAARVDEMADAIKASGSAAEEIQNVGKLISQTLSDAIKGQDLNTLLSKGFDLGDFTREISTQGATLRTEFDKIFSNFGPASRRFIDALDPAKQSLADLRLAFSNSGQLSVDFQKELSDAGITADDFQAIVGVLNGVIKEYGRSAADASTDTRLQDTLTEQTTGFNVAGAALGNYSEQLASMKNAPATGIDDINGKLEETRAKLEAAKRAADDFFGGTGSTKLQDALDQFVVNIPSLQARVQEINAPGVAGLLKEALERQLGGDIQADLRGLVQVGISEGKIKPTLAGGVSFLESLKQNIQGLMASGTISVEVGTRIIWQISQLEKDPQLASKIKAAAIAAGKIAPVETPVPVAPKPFLADPGALDSGIRALFSGGRQTAAHGLRGGAPGGGGAAVGTIDVNVPVNATLSLASSNAADMGQALAATFIAGVTSGIAGATAAGAALSLAAAQASATGIAGATVAGAGLGRGFGQGVRSQAGNAAGAGAFISAAAANAMRAAIGAAFAGGAALAASFASGIRAGTGNAVGAAASMGSAASSAVNVDSGGAFSAGTSLGEGLAAGIRAGAGAAIAAARAMAAAVSAAARNVLGIHSPSTVFRNIGREIGNGLALGMRDAKGDLSGVVDDVINDIVGKTMSKTQVLRDAFSELFKVLRPHTGDLDFTDFLRIEADTSQIKANLTDAFDQSRSQLQEALKKKPGERDAFERTIVARFQAHRADANDLNLTGPLGAQNRKAFLDAGQQIRDFIEAALRSGKPLKGVINQAKAYRQQLIDTVVAYGGSRKQALSLLKALGLLDPQLAQFMKQAEQLRKSASKKLPPAKDPDAEEERLRRENDALREQLRIARLNPARPLNVNVYPPYGDPEAIGLGAANRVAVALSGTI